MKQVETQQKQQELKQDNEFPILKIIGITKKFPGVVAVDNISLTVNQGEVHAVVGENGAGKTTFCNIITGLFPPDKGEIYVLGKKVHFTHPSQALQVGIRMVYQERNLISYLTGAQNICLREESTKWGVIVNEKQILKTSEQLKERIGVDVPLNIPVSYMSPAQRQIIEILRAFLYKPLLLILDEPTSSLTKSEIDVLFKTIKEIKKEGISVIFISHKIDEVFSISDIISVFRNGKKIITKKTCDMSQNECVKYMVNRDLAGRYPKMHPSGNGRILELEKISDYSLLHNINLYIRKGEVVGMYGLVGSGRTELAELIYGIRPIKKGKIIFEGKEIKPYTKKMLAQKLFLVPEDRREKGLFFNLNLSTNLTMSFFDKFTRLFGIINHKKEIALAYQIANFEYFKLKYTNINQDVNELSGGNKQKVVIGRWASHKDIKMLIMDEPTQGIDVGTKYEIYMLMRYLAEKKGVGVLFISSELPELIGICDRIYVFKEGTISGELNREEFDNEKILNFAL